VRRRILPSALDNPKIEQSPEALADFVFMLRKRFGSAPVALAVELKRGPLINFPSAFEFIDIYPVKTTTVAWYRKAFHPSGAKSAPLDCELILEILAKSCPDAFVFESLPGVGKALAPRLLCILGTRRERFPQAAGLAQYVGCAPVTERSGKQIPVHWRWSAPRFARQSFVEFAQWSVTHSVRRKIQQLRNSEAAAA